MIGILQNRLASCGEPLAEGGRDVSPTMNGEGRSSGEILAMAVGRIGSECNMDSQEEPSDVEETFGTSCHPLHLFAVSGVFDLAKQTM